MQQSQPVYPWSTHALPIHSHSHLSPSQYGYAHSTTATADGELFLFGGIAKNGIPHNDLYVFSTRDFSITQPGSKGETPGPRYGHGVALSGTLLLVWGGWTKYNGKDVKIQNHDDSLYLLNLVSRMWTRVEVSGRGPYGRCYHTVTLVGSNLFVFGGRIYQMYFNDIWGFNLNRLESNPLWESYKPAPEDKKPPPRSDHVSVTTGDRIIVFGGGDYTHRYNDTWSFDISTRKWTELQCTGSIPTPRVGYAAVLVGDVMYVFGGTALGGTDLGDLTALNLSTQRWTTFQDIGPSPRGRAYHVMASDGTRVFVLGGALSARQPMHEDKPIHVLDTRLLDYSKPNSNDVNPDVSPEKEIARLENERFVELERKLSAMLATQTKRDRRIAQLTDELAQNSSVLKQAEANATEARLEQREIQAKLDHATKANERNQRELAEVRAELEARKSELAVVHSRLADVENGWAKRKAEADTSGAKTANLVNTDEDGMHMLTERMRAMEAKIASLRWNEKSFEMMECRNEG